MHRETFRDLTVPRAAALSELLVDPVETHLDGRRLVKLRRWVRSELQHGWPGGDRAPLRVDIYSIRNQRVGQDQPFSWTPHRARRPIGLECVRGCVSQRAQAPAEASFAAINKLEKGRGSLARWVSSLGACARAAVQAEAVLWATHLLGAVEWNRLRNPIVGADLSVRVASNALIRTRIDLLLSGRPPCTPPGGRRADAHASTLTLMTGTPMQTSRLELGLVALGMTLSNGALATPGRAIGWWPQCGRLIVVPVTFDLLEEVGTMLSHLVGAAAAEQGLASAARGRNGHAIQPRFERAKVA
ncbi:MAG: hypothetical protein ACRDVP_01235 [Acidimicrobiales bacterium]